MFTKSKEHDLRTFERETETPEAFLTKVLSGEISPKGFKAPEYVRSISDVKVLLSKVMSDVREPRSYCAANDSPDSAKWREAVLRELNSRLENQTWEIVQPPKGAKVLEGRWVYTVKTDQDRHITRFKARWVVRGDSQHYGEDYDQTFAGVAKGMTIKALFALATQYDYDL